MRPYVAHLPARPYATNYDTQNQIWATSKGANGSMAHKNRQSPVSEGEDKTRKHQRGMNDAICPHVYSRAARCPRARDSRPKRRSLVSGNK